MKLTDIRTKSDKNAEGHGYLEIYDMLIHPSETFWFAEIGVQAGHSIELWQDFLGEGTNIYGFDIDIGQAVHMGKLKPFTRLFEGDAYEIGSDPYKILNSHVWDVIIDDGPHTLESMIFACTHYAPLADLFIIEDVPEASWVHELTAALPEGLRRYSYMIDRSALGHSGWHDDRLFVVDTGGTR